jgi:hypothetical protein
MKCKDFEERISFFMDREMDEEEREAWDKHLEGCGTCRELLATFRGIDSLVAAIPDPALKGLSLQDIMEKRKRRTRISILRLAASLTTLLLILGAFFLLPAMQGKQGTTILPITFMELTRPPEAHYTLSLNDSAYRLKVYGEEVTLLSCDIREKDRESEAELSITFKDTKKQ